MNNGSQKEDIKSPINVKLETGEVICDRCNGTGLDSNLRSDGILYFEQCTKCYGIKKLTWSENILGKENSLSFDSTIAWVRVMDSNSKSERELKVLLTVVLF